MSTEQSSVTVAGKQRCRATQTLCSRTRHGPSKQRCESKHALVLRLFHPPFLFCPSLHPSRHLPLYPLLFNPTADDATASSPDGSNTRVLPEPHGSHRCRTNAANGSFQCQRPGGYSHDTILRYTLIGTHTHALTGTVAGAETRANTHTHAGFLSPFLTAALEHFHH